MVAAFLPDADDWLISGRFARRAATLWGLLPHEARTLYLLCCGHTHHGELAQRAGLSPHSVRDRLHRVHRKLGVRGPAASAAAVRAAWPLYRACARPTRPEEGTCDSGRVDRREKWPPA